MTGITSGTALWYASRATGVVTLLLLTAVVLLGILVNRQGRLPACPPSRSPGCTGTSRCWRWHSWRSMW